MSLDDWFRETTIIGGRPTIKASAQTVTINGIKAYRLDSNLQPPDSLFEIVGIANAEERIFSIYAYSGKTNDNNILNKILSSFKFIDEIDETLWLNNLATNTGQNYLKDSKKVFINNVEAYRYNDSELIEGSGIGG